jgi:hypothetical protein
MNPYDTLPDEINGTPKGRAQMIADLEFCFEDPRWFSLAELEHLKSNFGRLARGSYHGDNGTGCIFAILTENRAPGQQIDCREALTRFFTGGSGDGFREMDIYQPAKWIVRAWDLQPQIPRYEGAVLSSETLRRALCKAIKVRSARENVRGTHHRPRTTRPQPVAV